MMNQSDIDRLIAQGKDKSETKESNDFSISNKPNKEKTGKVMGQISKVTKESEEGTNKVMNKLDDILNAVSRQKALVNDFISQYKDKPEDIDVLEVFNYINLSADKIENHVYSAMDTFQFQDINKQKLMKVMYTLSQLNNYLNDLLGYEDADQAFGHDIDNKTMEHDKNKDIVESIIADFKKQ